MLPLHHDPHFTFRFADDRIIPRFHLEGVEAGRRVSVFWIAMSVATVLQMSITAMNILRPCCKKLRHGHVGKTDPKEALALFVSRRTISEVL